MKNQFQNIVFVGLSTLCLSLVSCNPVSIRDPKSDGNGNNRNSDDPIPTNFDNDKKCQERKRKSFDPLNVPVASSNCKISNKRPLRSLLRLADNVNGILIFEFDIELESLQLRFDSYLPGDAQTITCKDINNGKFECAIPDKYKVLYTAELNRLLISQQRSSKILHVDEVLLKTTECPKQAWRFKVNRSESCSTEETELSAARDTISFPAIESTEP